MITHDVTVVEYDCTWPQRYAQEAARVRTVLGEVVRLTEHFGSTAVPGFAAKPIVDLIVLLEDVKHEPEALDALDEMGYGVRNDWELRTVLHRAADDGLGFNLHLCWPATLPEIRGNLAFRDSLRAHPAMRDRYGEIKRQAAADHPRDIEGYYRAKNGIVREIAELAHEADDPTRVDLETE